VCIYAPTVYTVNVHIAYISICLILIILKAQFSNRKAFFVCYVKVIWGSVTRWIYFLRLKHFNEYFLRMRWWISRYFKRFSLPHAIIIFLFASLKLLPNFKNAYWNPPQNFLLCDWSMFSSADLSLATGKMHKNNLSIFSVKIATFWSLKRVTKKIFKISK
jgi:hypothetical protein